MNLSLTIYNQGTALVREQRDFTLESGENTVDFTGVAETIDRTSVTVRAVPDAETVRILEQSFLYDLVGLRGLMRRYTDSRIGLTMQDGTDISGVLINGQRESHYGEALDFILRADDGQIQVVRDGIRDIRFPQLPEGLRTRPTLRWILESANSGDQTLELTYLADGMRWTADYNLLLAGSNDELNFIGWVTLTNESGTGFTDAQVKLIAGDVQRIQPEHDAPVMEAAPVMYRMAAKTAPVEQREMFEYQLYEIARRVSLENNETKQVEFLQKAGVPARITYQTTLNSYWQYGRAPMIHQHDSGGAPSQMEVYLSFSTGKDGLDADMPAGRMRVFQNDSDGAAVLIGESHISHTPNGEPVRVLLGRAFDLVYERKQTAFAFARQSEVTESFEISLRNRKDSAAVEIDVHERLFRWANWEIVSASHRHTQTGAATIQFTVSVPPREEVIVKYTVRYKFPRQ